MIALLQILNHLKKAQLNKFEVFMLSLSAKAVAYESELPYVVAAMLCELRSRYGIEADLTDFHENSLRELIPRTRSVKAAFVLTRARKGWVQP